MIAGIITDHDPKAFFFFTSVGVEAGTWLVGCRVTLVWPEGTGEPSLLDLLQQQVCEGEGCKAPSAVVIVHTCYTTHASPLEHDPWVWWHSG